MEFKKIQLNGFKSFADKTNFLIEDGLTGIVGPNGCGKSNIVESIRWVMGETSAKSLRGSGMEDVIFSGTSNKPSKNIAEVSITVKNDSGEGPIQYREVNEINVRRKIEKDKGSKFYINDKEVRARDSQMFFADLSTGAHSPSMISQGRIGALVTAKPTDRRAILEEAAGISGLHVRRHEAELRLGAAENNLKRADELRKQQERQLANLQKQAEEASKYKNITDEIKKIEAGLYYLKLIEIDKEITIENEINTEAESEVSGFNERITEIEKLIKLETEKVTPLREKNIENLSKIQRLNLELQSLDKENTRTQEEIENIEEKLLLADIGYDTVESIIEIIKKFKAGDFLFEVKKYLINELPKLHDATILSKKPVVVMVVGVNGTGKTTSVAKLAKMYKDMGNSVTLIAADTYRAAAVEQLKVWSKRANVDLVCNENSNEPSSVLFDGLSISKKNNSDIVIVDTAGRLHTYKNLMSELEKMHRITMKRFPEYLIKNIITIDSLLGQNSIVQAKEFNKHVPIDGAILTKLDGTAKGGIIFSLYKEIGIPVQFIGLGEELSDFEVFDPEKYVNGLIGVDSGK